MTPASPLLQVDHVSLSYSLLDARRSWVQATYRVSFDVYEHDRFVLLGPSGCGKSTLLKAIAGFHAAHEGTIRLDGTAITAPGPDRVVVFQEFDQLAPWKTVLENIAFPLRVARHLKRRDALEQARHYLAKVGLERVAHQYPNTLSGGMKQRVAIARGLAMRPRILLMDEPFAALDALTRRHMQEELLALWDDAPFTLLFVTHSIEEALIIGTRNLLLSPHPGRVRAELDTRAYAHGGEHGEGSPAFRHAVTRVHDLLFPRDTAVATHKARSANAPQPRTALASLI